MLAYCKQHNLPYHIPDTAYHCDGRKMYFPHLITGPELTGLQEYHELPVHATPNPDGTHNYNTPAYQDIPAMDNIKFVGYWQSFRYFDWCRDYILEKFQLPYEKQWGKIGVHIRRGDFLQLQDKHPVIPIEYYTTAIRNFIVQGYTDFQIFSDDTEWCSQTFTSTLIPGANFTVYKQPEIQDMIMLSWCAHQILCYSTFGFIAAWLNQNPNKQVIIPPSRYCFSGSNQDFIPDTFIQLEF